VVKQVTKQPSQGFYEILVPYYHLIYQDWDASMQRQGAALDSIIQSEWGPAARIVLDAAAGIGTQAIALAARGYSVTASDISPVAIERALKEAQLRGVTLKTAVADLRSLSQVHGMFDVVLACDNALPHLLTDVEIRQALLQCYKCTRPGGGCVISIRDYGVPGSGIELRPHGIRDGDGARHILFQVWEWDGSHYDMSLYVITDGYDTGCQAIMAQTRYYAISVEHVAGLMREAGFNRVSRLDGIYFQPVLIGTRPETE
jgi:SAM-dependent methyltransferase